LKVEDDCRGCKRAAGADGRYVKAGCYRETVPGKRDATGKNNRKPREFVKERIPRFCVEGRRNQGGVLPNVFDARASCRSRAINGLPRTMQILELPSLTLHQLLFA
jgi:hypothetical protein